MLQLKAKCLKKVIHGTMIDYNLTNWIVKKKVVYFHNQQSLVNSVKKTNRLVIVEESWPFGSVSSEITYQVQKHAFDYLDAPIKRVTGADSSMHYAANLVEAYMPNTSKVMQAVKSAMYK
jgi:pyruvate/2-oxoglutarate/acetoin dehydrogenase E1 component